jgi:hypothetical protein
MSTKKIFVLSASILILSGCATSSDKIATAYVSPLQYQSYDCDQLTSESVRLNQRVMALQGQVDKAAANDKAVTGVGMILFWPALFALGGNTQQEAEYGRLKGEYEAIQQSAVAKKCPGMVPAGGPASIQTATTAPAVVPTAAPAALAAPQPALPGEPAKAKQ